MRQHNRKPKEHGTVLLWEKCLLQTYFTRKGQIEYFIVVDNCQNSDISIDPETTASRRVRESELFAQMEKGYLDAEDDLRKEASVVHDFGNSRSE